VHFGYVRNELTKRKRRSAFVILGIALSVGVLVAVNALADAFMAAAQKPLRDFGADIIVQRSGDTPDDFAGATLPCSQVIITAGEVERLKNVDGILDISTALLMWVFEGTDYSDRDSFAIVTGIEPGTKAGPGIVNDWLVEGAGINPGDTGAALVESVYAGQKGIKVGDTVTITGQPFEARGIVRTPANSLISVSNIFIPLSDAQGIAVKAKNISGYAAGDVNELFVRAEPEKLGAVIEEIKSIVPETSVSSAESFIQAIGGIAAQSGNLAVSGSIVVLLLAMVIVVKTISGNIMERRNEIGIMKTVGWTSKDIYRQVIAETALQSFIGGIAGIAAGFAVSLALGRMRVSIPVSWDIDPFPHFMMTDTSAKALDVSLPVRLSPGLAALALAAALAAGILSALLTLRAINKIKPQEVLRYE
jgi:putative ABC transport system permease protein